MLVAQETGASVGGIEPPPSCPAGPLRRILSAAVVLTVLLAILTGLYLLVRISSRPVARAWDFLMGDPSARVDAHFRLVILDVRLRGTFAAVFVGVCLGAAGCLLQAVTRNPLADSWLIGVNFGCSLGLVIGFTYFGVRSSYVLLVWALAGGMAASVVVLLLAAWGRGAASLLRLVLVGSALVATFYGMTSYVLLSTQSTFDTFGYWTIGSLAGLKTSVTCPLIPVIVIGLLVVFGSARSLVALALGEDGARALGHRPGLIRVVVAAALALLAGSAVPISGPIAFVGLLTSHAARAVSGSRMAAQLALSALIAVDVMIAADILTRVAIRPWETAVSVFLAFVGGPLLIWIARSRRLSTAGGTA
ncbi:FecCD family ABC transporter permease [Streptomyces rimosus]|uniref:FecCD family ABC transporter permease n=1 Tax=Streptomyces rimosus TaxID=1927 RepID=UPI00311F8ACD